MIVQEYLNDNTLIRHYSDSGFMIRQKETGNVYSEAVDLVPCAYEYEETDIIIEVEAEEEQTYDESV